MYDIRTALVNLYQPNNTMYEEIYIGYATQNGTSSFGNIDGTDPTWSNWLSPPSVTPPSCAVSSMSNNYSWIATDCLTQRGIVCAGVVQTSNTRSRMSICNFNNVSFIRLHRSNLQSN